MKNIDLQQLINEISDNNITEIETSETHDIAIIGITVKLPYAEDLNQFWENLKTGKDCITELPTDRKSEADKYLNHILKKVSAIKYKKGSYIDGIDEFDYGYFNISPREASLMDPNQRMFLEIALSAVEDAGYGGEKLKGSKTGVY
ncbi:MAG: polyketide synthase, partial [Firmicutes bacterium]|nr:polyketide synthase [Bacillota bacterium]